MKHRSLFLGLVILLGLSCQKEYTNAPQTPIVGLELPPTTEDSPVIAGRHVVIKGAGFTAASSIILNSSDSSRVVTVIEDVSDSTITFIAPNVSGLNEVILIDFGKQYILGKMHFSFLEEEIYASVKDGADYFLYRYDVDTDNFIDKQPFLPTIGIVAVQNRLYYMAVRNNQGNKSLYRYDLDSQEEVLITSNTTGVTAIGLINHELHLVKYESGGFSLYKISGTDEHTIVEAFGQPSDHTKYQFNLGVDDDYVFSYDANSKTLLLSGTISTLDNDVRPIIMTLSMSSQDIATTIYTDSPKEQAYYLASIESETWLFQSDLSSGKPTIEINRINTDTHEVGARVNAPNTYLGDPVYHDGLGVVFGFDYLNYGTADARKVPAAYNVETSVTKSYDFNLQYLFLMTVVD